MAFEIVVYERENGSIPFMEFLESLSPKMKAKILRDLDLLEEIAHTIKDGSLCGLGKTAPNHVLSTLKYFRDEYIAHIKDHKCPAGVCTAMKKIVIQEDLCKGCTKCARNCPVEAISGEIKQPHHIDQSKCIKCEACLKNCPFKAIVLE